MNPSPATQVVQSFVKTNRRILTFAERLSDEQLRWSPDQSHSIAFHLWHIARWTDCFQAALPGMTPTLTAHLEAGVQVWHSSQLAQSWGFDRVELGISETGMEMGDDMAAQLHFPSKEILLDYARQVFAVAEQSVQAINDEEFQATEQWQPMVDEVWGESTVGDSLLTHLTHSSRHLGMMECLLGLQTKSGSATS
jgi:hypothetical protein